MTIDPNEIYDQVRGVIRCEHNFGTHRTEAVGADGKSRVIRGRCEKCASRFPTEWTEVQNLSPYSLYLIASALAPVLDKIVREAVLDVLVGHLVGDDPAPEPPLPTDPRPHDPSGTVSR